MGDGIKINKLEFKKIKAADRDWIIYDNIQAHEERICLLDQKLDCLRAEMKEELNKRDIDFTGLETRIKEKSRRDGSLFGGLSGFIASLLIWVGKFIYSILSK